MWRCFMQACGRFYGGSDPWIPVRESVQQLHSLMGLVTQLITVKSRNTSRN